MRLELALSQAEYAKACGGLPSSEATGAAAGVPEFVTPPSNTGVNKIQPVAQGFK